jgi:single-stranded-DNA-specific exonuclease
MTLFWGGENWHEGVLGIVASRLVEKYHRPSLVFGVKNKLATGSGRSIHGFDLYESLTRCGVLFEKCGGHAMAAGFTLKASNLEKLKTSFEKSAKEALTPDELTPHIDVDAEIRLQDINLEMLRQINVLSPFGEGNPEPVFLARSLQVLDSRVVGDRHLKLRVRQGAASFEAIGFGLGDRYPLKSGFLDLLFCPELNRWQGNERIQLRIMDLRAGDGNEKANP